MNLVLKMRILKSGKKQIALAHEIGVPEPVFSKIVNGWIRPKQSVKNKIAEALNCKPEDIFPENGGTEAERAINNTG